MSSGVVTIRIGKKPKRVTDAKLFKVRGKGGKVIGSGWRITGKIGGKNVSRTISKDEGERLEPILGVSKAPRKSAAAKKKTATKKKTGAKKTTKKPAAKKKTGAK